jgi:FixJ family two-component response regulator
MSEPDPIVYVVEDDDISPALIIALSDSIGLAFEAFADASEFLDNGRGFHRAASPSASKSG